MAEIKIFLFLLAGMALLWTVVAICAGIDSYAVYTREVELKNGKTVNCVLSKGVWGDSISCNWEGLYVNSGN